MVAAATINNAFKDRVFEILAHVPDPEIPCVSVVDLGIVRGVRRDPPAVLIAPTYSGCPATVVIERSVRRALDDAGFGEVLVKTVLSPPWTTDWITERGRERLREYGIAPPPRGSAARSLRGDGPVECPRCGSTDTEEISRFGSTNTSRGCSSSIPSTTCSTWRENWSAG